MRGQRGHTQHGGQLHEEGEGDNAFSANVMRELEIVQDYIKHWLGEVGVYGRQVVGESLDVVCNHSKLGSDAGRRASETTYWSGFFILSSRLARILSVR